MSNSRPQRALHRHGPRTGVAAVEFALVAPFLILLFVAVAVYGGWYWLAHSVQALAAEAARAAVAGLDPVEREALARAEIAAQAPGMTGLAVERLSADVDETAERLTVTVRRDLTEHPLTALAGPLPRPPEVLSRSAVVRVGGY